MQRSKGCLAFLGVVFVVLIVLVSFILISFNKVTVTVQPGSDTVVTQIRNLSRVETVSYTLEKVINYDQDANSIWHFLGNHTKLFVVHGEVIAGLDLSSLSKNDVNINKKSITINLPPPQILVTTLDESKTRVYDSNSGVYGLWNEGLDANTELHILAQAKTSLHDDACSEGILQKAAANAKTQFTAFLTSLGFTTITINIPNGKC